MVDRTKAPQFKKPEYFPLQQAETRVLRGGIPLHVFNSGSQEIVRLEIIFKAGKWFEEKNGSSTLTGKLLTEGGTQGFSSFEISKIFERNGAFFEISPGFDFINFSIYSLSKNLYKLSEVIEDILFRPLFSENDLETQKSIQVQNLKVNLEKTSFLASREFRRSLFGDQHPYGATLDEEDIHSISRNNLLEFFEANVKSNFEVVLSGHFSDHDLSHIVSFFDQVTKVGSEEFIYHRNSSAPVLHQSKPGSLQASIRIGKPVIGKHDENYPILLIFNEILGGYFGSRLMQNLREDKGFTYGVHSSVVPLLKDTYFVISTDVIEKSKEEAVKEIYYELNRLIETKVDDQELNTVKNYFKGSFLSGISSPFSLADKFKNIYFHGLDYRFYSDLFEKIDAMTPSAIQEFASQHFGKNDFVEVVIG